ncbi:MAG: LysM peptidoglycan-binding domain-containing protein [Stenotrophobium sp.]
MLNHGIRLAIFAALLSLGCCAEAGAAPDTTPSTVPTPGPSTAPAPPPVSVVAAAAAITPKSPAVTAPAATPDPASPATAVTAASSPATVATQPAEVDTVDDSDDTTALVTVTNTAPVFIDPTVAEARDFPRYPMLKPVVAFWTRVFSQYSKNQSVIQSSVYPQKIYTVLDFSDAAARMSPEDLSKYRARAEADAKDQVNALLKQVNALRHAPEKMNSEQRKIYDLFSDVRGDNRFLDAVDTFRAQRGLKERTEEALNTSEKYLPSMEATFRKYDMPVTLTRLPLVESSFNVDAYSKAGASGLWQFIPSSARIYMRLNNIVDDRRDPWTSTDAAARHLRDDYAALHDWPLAITAYNQGRGGISRALTAINGTTLVDLIQRSNAPRFGFAGRNYYAEFLAATDVERSYQKRNAADLKKNALRFDIVETKHYVPYETLRRLCGASDDLFRSLNPAYRPEVIEGRMYVPPGHLIRVPAGSARAFEVAYSRLPESEKYNHQRVYYTLHRIKHGESLGMLARHYGVSISALLAANDMNRHSLLHVGHIIRIPPRYERSRGPVSVALRETDDEPVHRGSHRHSHKARAYHVHRVRSGQTLSGIAKRYDTTIGELREANNLGHSSHIKAGMVLKIPS